MSAVIQALAAQKIATGGGGGSTAFISSFTPGTYRNNASFPLGMKVTVGGSPLTVTSLGRWIVSGNSASHVLTIRDGSNTVLATATLNTSGQTPGAFAYVALGTPYILSASTAYYFLSAELSGGDQWCEFDGTIGTTAAGTMNGWAYSLGSITTGASASCYVPCNFLY